MSDVPKTIKEAVARANSNLENKPVDLKPSSVKCSTCNVRCKYDSEEMEVALNTCKNRLGAAHNSRCGLAQNLNFIRRMNALAEHAKNKGPGWLLENKEKPVQVETKKPRITASQVAAHIRATTEQGELTVPDPVVIFIHKNGNVERRSG